MKKSLMLVSLITFALVGCSSVNTNTSTNSNSTILTSSFNNQTTNTQSINTQEDTTENNTNSTDSKVLIVYFDNGSADKNSDDSIVAGSSNSYGGNNTYSIASTLHRLVSSDLVELALERPYSSEDLNYNHSDARVVIEHNRIEKGEKVRPQLASTFSVDPSLYTHVIVGYPLWWMNTPWPLLTLFEDTNYDWSNKTFGAFNANHNNSTNIDSNLRNSLLNSKFITPGYYSASDTSSWQNWINTLLVA